MLLIRFHDRPSVDAAFERLGLSSFPLPFVSSARLPPDVVAAFLQVTIRRPGANHAGPVAINHADGRGGLAAAAMCGLFLMAAHGFAAGEAAAWLRLASAGASRPPLPYLRVVESTLRHAAATSVRPILGGFRGQGKNSTPLYDGGARQRSDDERRAAVARAVYRVWARGRRYVGRTPGRIRPQSSYSADGENDDGREDPPAEAAAVSTLTGAACSMVVVAAVAADAWLVWAGSQVSAGKPGADCPDQQLRSCLLAAAGGGPGRCGGRRPCGGGAGGTATRTRRPSLVVSMGDRRGST